MALVAGTKAKGTNAGSVRAHNLRSLMLTMLRKQPIARVRLARETGISPTTVTNLVAELIALGIVVESGTDLEAATPGAGRPPRALSLQPESRYAIGVNIGVRQVHVALVDLQANIHEHMALDLATNESAEHAIERIAEVCLSILLRHTEQMRPGIVVGVGVGASGLVQTRTGVNVFAPNLGWHDVPMASLLSDKLQMQVAVDNNVRCMALAESLYGVGRSARALAYVYARVGVGAGLVVDGEIYRGADYGAGEIGHWVMTPHGEELCSCGNRGCLETYISERTLLERAEQIHPELTQGREDALQVIFDAARDGHLGLVEMLEERAYYLGLALANLVNGMNPQMIVLGGWLYEAFDLIEPVAQGTMRRHAFGAIGDRVDILPTSFGSLSGVVGAAVLALESFLFSPLPSPHPNHAA